MRNPFRYGLKVTGDEFFDRRRIAHDMINVLEGGNNVVLYGPRRYGKSSLVGEVAVAMRKRGWACAELNLMDIASLDDFVAKYARAVYREIAPAVGTLKHVLGLFQRVTPTIGMDDSGRPELRFQIGSSKAGLDALRDVLELPERLLGEGRRMMIALDEFQEVGELGLGMQFERTMRSIVQEQRKVSYVFLGSKTHMLQRMFAAPSRPFYNSAQKFMLKRPPADESARFLIDRFKSVKMSLPPQLAERMIQLVDNVPYYLQALGSWVFGVASGRNAKTISDRDIDEGFDSLYASERILLENVFVAHSESQRLLMRAIAVERTARFDEQYRARHLLASTSTVNTALRRLIAESTVDEDEHGYVLADPLLAWHVRQQQ